MTLRDVMVVFGTRPEALQLAPVIHALGGDPRSRPVVVVAAPQQHPLIEVLDLFELTPDHELEIPSGHDGLTATAVDSVGAVGRLLDARQHRPDLVVVQGDTTTTFAGALAAAYRRIPVAHV